MVLVYEINFKSYEIESVIVTRHIMNVVKK